MENVMDDFLGKNLRADVRGILNKYGDGLDGLVAFGSQLIDWDLTREGDEKKDGYLVPILFLRNFIENVDAIAILVRHGACDPAKSLLRTAVENFFSLEYLLSESQHERSMSFHVWNTYHNLKLYEKLDGTSAQANELQGLLEKDKMLTDKSPLVLAIVDKMKANAMELLALPLYRDFAAEYEKTKIKFKKRKVYWYSLHDGPASVAELANKSRFPALYEIYRGLSNTVHGVDIIQGKIAGLGDGRIGIDQLRFPRQAHSLTQYAHTLSATVFGSYVSARLPERANEYQQWLVSTNAIRQELAKGDPINFKQ
jgi:hypothetical protein